ncbi:Dabb family protein [Pseudonocardia sp. TRM90224]|uniref:Dabb family protein n=1 Tax=Pseudonocardia sp. TRM90224 TaxID=2812678 RepID=UPI001E4D7F15|nr:Dabb family protein [Pseudonocardia sp. TRM90224]
MIVNVLRFRLRDGITPDQEAEVVSAMRRTAALDSVAFGSVGRDLSIPDEGYALTYVVGIPDLEALERYMHDPVHLAGDDVILPHVASAAAVRSSDDGDPEIAAKVGALHAAKAAKYPDWGRTIEKLFS